VREALAADRQLSSLTLDELRGYSTELDDEAGALLAQDGWLESKASEGGTALVRVREQLAAARALLD
jgi:argininosuccinate lyase